MKKLILLCCFGAMAFAASAQDTRIEPITTGSAEAFTLKEYRFSVSATPLISWMSPDSRNISSKGSRVGIGGGLFVEKNISRNVGFGAGLHITQMGGKIGYDSLVPNDKSGDSYTNVEYTYKIRYVEIPALVRLRTDEFGYNRVYFEAGFAFDFLWRARADINQNVFTNAKGGSEDRNINEDRADFEASRSVVNEDDILFMRIPIIAGAGWEYALSQNTVFFAGLRYNAGLLNVMRANNTRAFNNYLALNIGVMF